MKTLFMISVFCTSILFGCDAAVEKKAPSVLSGTEQADRPVEAQSPYYHGLIEEYRTVLAEDPNNLAALIALGNAYFEAGQWQEAIRNYESALRLDPRNADVRSDLGTSYRQLGMSGRALAEYRLALEHEPEHLNARYNMGIVYAYDRKDRRAAVKIWEELLKLAPYFPQADRIRSSMATLKQGAAKDAR